MYPYGAALGTNSTGFGYFTIADGYNSAAIGYGAEADGANSIALGQCITSQNGDISIGYDSWTFGGSYLVALGAGASAVGGGCVSVGGNSYSTNGSTAIGYNAYAQGQNSTALGFDAQASDYSIAIGQQSGGSGTACTSQGYFALTTGTGDGNTAIGYRTLSGMAGSTGSRAETGSFNTGVGAMVEFSNYSGHDNSALGYRALLLNTVGISNTAVGSNALANTLGSGNTAVGDSSGLTNVSGTNNTFLGYYADASTDPLTNATAIGSNAYVGESNAVIIGSIAGVNGASSSVNVGIGTTTPAYPLQMGSGAYCTTGGVWTNASDRRLKRNITPSVYGLKEVLKLTPVQYVMRSDSSRQVGFIAQDVKQIVPEVVSGKEGDISKGETLGLSYGNLVPVLTKAIQEQQAQIDELKKEVNELKLLIKEIKK